MDRDTLSAISQSHFWDWGLVKEWRPQRVGYSVYVERSTYPSLLVIPSLVDGSTRLWRVQTLRARTLVDTRLFCLVYKTVGFFTYFEVRVKWHCLTLCSASYPNSGCDDVSQGNDEIVDKEHRERTFPTVIGD